MAGEKISESEGRVTDALYRYVNDLNMSTKKQKFSDGTKKLYSVFKKFF